MKYLLFINALLCWSLAGCTIKAYRNFKADETSDRRELRLLFNDTETQSYLFKTAIDFRQQHFSGLLLIKRLEEKIFRAVFTTEVGLKIFDIEINPSGTVVHYALEGINRKHLISLIENDMKLLLNNSYDAADMSVLTDDDKVHTLYKLKKEKNYFLVENSAGRIVQADNANLFGKSLITIRFSDYQYNFPQNISITHGKVPLDLQLHYIKR